MDHAEDVSTQVATDRIPSLDGLRGVAISLVILAHLGATGTAPWLSAVVWRFDLGGLGVRVFFGISGFLITTLLLKEQSRHGKISLRRFYIRRILRIMPAYYTFLGLMAVAATFGLFTIHISDFVKAGTYTSDYFTTVFPVGHTWSLSVEEQFYLLWPGIIVVAGVSRGVKVCLALLLLSPMLRALAALIPEWPVNTRYAFETVGDAIAFGCLLALLRDRLWMVEWYQRLVSSRLIALFPFVAVVLTMANFGNFWFSLIGVSTLNLLVVIIIDHVTRFPSGPLGRMLNYKVVAYIGTLSYSLYLWQQPFLMPSVGVAFPLNVIGAIGFAMLSYYLVERSLLRVRTRFGSV